MAIQTSGMGRCFAAILAGSLMVACTQSAQARLGETLEQCVKRYGKPISQSPVELGLNVQFTFKGTPIYAVFANNTCEVITFNNVSPELMNALLDANKGQSQWGEVYDKPNGGGGVSLIWERKDGARASLNPQLKVMQFRSPNVRQRDKQKEEAAVSGF